MNKIEELTHKWRCRRVRTLLLVGCVIPVIYDFEKVL